MNKLFAPVTAKDHAEGPANAPVAFVEYGDYQCPTCGQAFSIVQRLQKHFGDKLRFVFHTFPLPMHPYAEHAAETAEFAAAHDKFWPMHDLLFKHQSNLADEELLRLAEQLGLSSDALAKAFTAGTYRTRVQRDVESGKKSGVTGTLMFYINGAQTIEAASGS